MYDLTKWFGTSLGIHLGGAALVVWLTAETVKPSPPVIIDFTLNASPAPEQKQKRSGRLPPVPRQRVMAPTAVAPRQERAHQESPPTPAASRNPPLSPSVPQGSRAASEDMSRHVSPNMTPPVAVSAPNAAQAGGEKVTSATARQLYLKEHFAYIRDLITKRLSYPLAARRMGWSGRLVLSFVVAEDGAVRSVHVKESCGYPLLDNSAMETVRNCAPFPKPPVAAEIVIPVQYRLQ